jgi:AcrR family transcriptional regulator
MPRHKRADALPPQLPPAKERIMDAAADLYMKIGIHVPLAAIANAAQTNVDTIVKYYGNWEGLVIEFLRRYETDIEVWRDLEAEFPNDVDRQVRGWVEGVEALASDADWSSLNLQRAAAIVRNYPQCAVLPFIRKLKRQERNKLAEKCEAAGFSDPKGLADKLMLLAEGALASFLTHGLQGPAVELCKIADLIMAAHRKLAS